MKTNWLRTKRKELHISQEELAAKLQVKGIDVTAGAISHWENGRYNPPLDEPEFRKALAEILRIDVRTLLMIAGYEVTEIEHTDAAKRAAFIVDQLPPDKRILALSILEKFLESA